MVDLIPADLLARLTARRRLFGGALGLLVAGALPSLTDATRKAQRRKKKKRELRKRSVRWNARRRKRLGRQYVAHCLASLTYDTTCDYQIAACCQELRDLNVDDYCLCLAAETCSYCLDWP